MIEVSISQLDCSLCGCLTFSAQKYASREKHKSSKTNKVFDTKEIDWFSRNGYNLGLRGIIEWTPELALGILTATFGFLELYTNLDSDITRRSLQCAYLCSGISIELARRNETKEGQLQHYLFTRNHVENFRKRFGPAEFSGDGDIVDLYARMLPWDFESAAKLKNWDALVKIVEDTKDLPGEHVVRAFAVMGDVVMSARSPDQTLLTVLQRIVEHQMGLLVNVGMRKMSGWIRLLVQFSLKRDLDAAEDGIRRAIELTRSASAEKYPEEELAWLTGG